MTTHSVTRRSLIVAGVTGASALALAGCSGGGSAKTADSSTADPRSTSAPKQSPVADSSSAAAESSATPAVAAGAATTLTALSDIRVGEAVSVKLPDNKPGVVARPTSSTAVCFSAICTHMGCTVKPAGAKLDCPCHGSQFSATTGKVLAGPAPSPLPNIAVQVVDGKVVMKG